MEKFWKKNKNGLTGTVLFHVLILLLLLFAPGFSSIFPPPEGEALLINFGTSDSGSGMIQPERVESTPDRQRQESIQSRDEIPTQDIEDAPVVKTSTETQDQQEEIAETEDVEENDPEVNPDLLFNNNRENNKSDSEGNDKSGNGDKGSEEGDPSSPNYEGSNIPGGSGIAYNLSGRTGNLPKPQYTSKEQGKVVVEIKVDRYGKVINAVPGAKGSTTHDKALWEAAKKAALNAKFNKKLDASEYQIGTITYTFILQ